jgi:carbonic anhydrase
MALTIHFLTAGTTLSGLKQRLAGVGLSLLFLTPLMATETPDKSTAASKSSSVKPSSETNTSAQEMGNRVREALESSDGIKKRLTLTLDGKDARLTPPAVRRQALPAEAARKPTAAESERATLIKPAPGALSNQLDSRNQLLARVKPTIPKPTIPSLGAHWSYEGETGPDSWGKLKPEYSMCASGTRQSPIHIDQRMTLQGPAEMIQFDYQPSGATVVNNGRTIQVDVEGDNSMTVRGSNYKLVQFHFHHPSEERINNKTYAMSVHLVHRNQEGQLAILAVLFDTGPANALIHKVWTYMPLDKNDAVRVPPGQLDLNQVLPKDMRYFQFLGSLTTPPCTEGVLWMILKQPATLSPEQLKLFGQIYPNNVRPIQPLNDRAVRDAQ